MAREVTPVFGWDTPILGEEANVPSDLKSLANDVETTIKELEPKRLKTAGAGDAKKLLIVDATGAAAFKAMSGDATISEAGALTIANEAVTAAKVLALAITEAKLAGESVATAKIANLAVTAAKLAAEAVETAKIQNLAVTEAKLAALAVGTAKIADAAVTSRKWSPTSGAFACSETKALAGAYADVVGGLLEITPATAGFILLNVTWKVGGAAGGAVTAGWAEGTVSIGGVDQTQVATRVWPAEATGLASGGSMSQFYRLPLAAALNTIKLRVKGVNGSVFTVDTRATYLVHG